MPSSPANPNGTALHFTTAELSRFAMNIFEVMLRHGGKDGLLSVTGARLRVPGQVICQVRL